MNSFSNLESERTFLVRELPDLSSVEKLDIEQAYLSVGIETVRVRKTGDRYEMTTKTALNDGDLSRRSETNTDISEDEYLRLRESALGITRKKRYLIDDAAGNTIELDIFEGDLKGLMKAEVEFKNEPDRMKFSPPDWLGREVTGEAWILNANLIGKTYDQVKHMVEK